MKGNLQVEREVQKTKILIRRLQTEAGKHDHTVLINFVHQLREAG